MEFYQSGAKNKIRTLVRVVSDEPKLTDYQLMEMCGLLPSKQRRYIS
jgi:hypothetical protein